MSATEIGAGIGEEALQRAARQVTERVGGGCLIRAVEPESGVLRTVAADHLDPERRSDLRSRPETARPLEPPGGWLGQALERGRSLRLPRVDPQALRGAGLPEDDRIGDAYIAPALPARAVIVAFRDRVSDPYTELQRRQIEQIAARAGAELVERDGEDADPVSGAQDTLPQGLLDLTTAGMWLTDPGGLTVWVNQAASELAACPAAELLGIPISSCLGAPVPRKQDATDGGRTSERTLAHPDGTRIWVTVTSRQLLDADGRLTGTLYTLFDTGERRRREVELRLRLQQQEALVQLAERAAGRSGFEELVGAAVATVQEQLDVEFVAIGGIDTDRAEGWALAARGWDPEALGVPDGGPPRRNSLAPSSASLVAARTGEPVLVSDYATQTEVADDPRFADAGVRCGAVVPFADGRGGIGAHSRRPGAIDAQGIAVMESVARLVAPRWRSGDVSR